MRRLLVLAGLFLLFALPAPVAAHAPSRPCSASVSPKVGGPSTTFRISGKHFPLAENGGSLEVQIDIMRVVFDDDGERLELQSVMWLSLIPEIHKFYVDYPDPFGEATKLEPGHYVVGVESAHQAGCRTVAGFDVVRRR